ncbi:MAG: hypothetical protein CM1200mP29_12330 [Verrucomicrobiota bacterium]|nr:MAG: hypothetical protein CM1200mP29_12330 [Verrucomicrobiota bacterium]
MCSSARSGTTLDGRTTGAIRSAASLRTTRFICITSRANRWPGGNPETGYLNCDGSPTKTMILNQRREGIYHYWNLNFGKRPQEELFDLKSDIDCVKNLANLGSHSELKAGLKQQLFAELREQGDPRMFEKGDVFDNYPYSGESTDNFYRRYMGGEKVRAGWVKSTDFEKEKLD